MRGGERRERKEKRRRFKETLDGGSVKKVT